MLNRLFFTLAFGIATLCVHAQNQLMLAFYNQENLFDTIDDPNKNDNEFLPSAKKEWNTEKYKVKLKNMSRVIGSMNNGTGPDILGMCEVENKDVLIDLTMKTGLKTVKYGIVHSESPDERSIDNALFYKQALFEVTATAAYPIKFETQPELKTRDILLVKLKDKKKRNLVVLVNHFPSRVGGQEASEPRRIAAALVLKHIFDSIAKVDPTTAVFAIGDFNDEPTDRSLDSVLVAKNTTESPRYNALYDLKLQGKGSHMYQKHWTMLDQVIMSRNAANCQSAFCYVSQSAGIYVQDWMLETEEKYKGAPMRTYAGNKFLGGYSDHLPVYILLKTK